MLITHGTYTLSDATLAYQHQAPAQPSRRLIVLLHRGHEYGGRLAQVSADLAPLGAHVVAWDARGHGDSSGVRGAAPDGFPSLVADLDGFLHHLVAELDVDLEHTVVVAHSVAAVVAATLITDTAPRLAGLVALTPAFRIRLFVPGARQALCLLDRARPQARIPSYVRGKWLSRDPDEAQAYDQDPAISHDIANRVLVGLDEAATRCLAGAGGVRLPVLLVQAGDDRVVEAGPQDAWFAELSSPAKQRLVLPAARHGILHDLDRATVVAAIGRFVTTCWERTRETPAEVLARPATRPRAIHAELTDRPGPLAAVAWAGVRAAIALPGRSARGVRIGLVSGFDSGSCLDHVYDDTAQGWGPLGRAVDRVFLDAVGWQGIRQRKTHLRAAITSAAHGLRAAGLPVHLLDICLLYTSPSPPDH
jgi:alpha-beta hydrolase superfamily lysophospholipase